MYKTADGLVKEEKADKAMQRFGFSAAHLQLTMPVGSLEMLFGLQYLRVSNHVLTLRGTQAGKAVPTLLCSFALNAQEESYPRRLESLLAEPPGLLIRRPKAPMDYSGKVSIPAPRAGCRAPIRGVPP